MSRVEGSVHKMPDAHRVRLLELFTQFEYSFQRDFGLPSDESSCASKNDIHRTPARFVRTVAQATLVHPEAKNRAELVQFLP